MFELVETTGKKIARTNKLEERNLAIVNDRLSGATFRELAKKYNISNASISYVLNKDEVKAILNDALNHLASFAPLLVKNYRDLLESSNENIKFKATESLASVLGLKPSNVPSQINNMYIQQNVGVISESMQELINKIGAPVEFVDAEFEELIS